MAKKQPKTIQFDTYTAGIFGRTEGYANRVRQLYAQAVTELLKIAQSQDVGENEMFEFDKMPKKLRNEANKVLRLLYTSVFNEVQHGIRAEWEYANLSNDIIIKRAFGDAVFKNEGNHFARWFGRNQQALEAFLKRKAGPERLGLSDRIWNYTGQLKDEMELALTVSMGQGESASTMSRKVRQYLQEPDRLFRHVKGKDGKMVWSKAAKAYLKEHDVGKGQYLSSYKNAMRLTRTETNMAYRQSDHDRWQQMDFVLGIHIQRAHRDDNDKNEICELLQGDYPKGFDFTGWHPQCRCIATPILATPEEMAAMRKALKEGKDPRSVLAPGRYITEPPAAFTQWISDNRERIENAKSVPYFIRDNFKDGNIDKGYSWVKTKKQKTQEEKNAIIEKWNERKRHNTLITKMGNNVYNVAAGYPDIDTSDLVTAINNGNISKIEEYSRTIAKQVAGLNKELRGMESIIDNPKQWLAQGFKVADLKSAYNELDGVMSKWLAKYNYSSISAAPLQHLKNKLDFELTNPSVKYSDSSIIKNVLTEKIRLIDKKLEWENLVSRVQSLQSFKTRSSKYKDILSKINEAVSNSDFDALQKGISDAEELQRKIVDKNIKRGGDIKSALNTQYKGGATGKDLSQNIDTSKMVSEDPYRGTFTNNVARMQGFDAPAKLVSEAEFDMLAKVSGDVFYRTVNPTTFKGKEMSSKEFASQLYVADLLELNGPGGRVYGDGMYVATSAWDGYKLQPLSESSKMRAHSSSICYGRGKHTISEMTWTRVPKIINQRDLYRMWNRLTSKQQEAFGYHENTYACALGYDAMYCEGADYMVIWNRSIIAVKKK